MSTLIEVDMSSIQEAACHLKKCQRAGKEIIKRLKEQKTTVKTWIFFNKQVSVWEYLATIQGWQTRAHYAFLGGFITENEVRLVDLANKQYDFESYTKQGRRVFLTPGDYRSLIWILETRLW